MKTRLRSDSFRLEFRPADPKWPGSGPTAYVVLQKWTGMHGNDAKMLTPDAVTFKEFAEYIQWLKNDLDAISKQAERRFAKAERQNAKELEEYFRKNPRELDQYGAD